MMKNTYQYVAKTCRKGDHFTLQCEGTVSYDASAYTTKKALIADMKEEFTKEFKGYSVDEIRITLK